MENHEYPRNYPPAVLPTVKHLGAVLLALAQSFFVSGLFFSAFGIQVTKAPMSVYTADAYVWSYVAMCSGAVFHVLAEMLLRLARNPPEFFFHRDGNSLHILILAWASLLFAVYPSLVYLLLWESEKGKLRETFEDAFLAVAWVPAVTLVFSSISLAIIYYYWNSYREFRMLPAEES